MMQRLQSFQDAQPSSYAIVPTKESAEANNQNSGESLAAEFQSILAQLAGQLAGIPDQLSAIGLSFAQPTTTTVKKTVQSELRAQGDIANNANKDVDNSDSGGVSTVELKLGDDVNQGINEDEKDEEHVQNKAQGDGTDAFHQSPLDTNFAGDTSIQDEFSRLALDLAISQNSKTGNLGLSQEIAVDTEEHLVDIDNQPQLIDPTLMKGSAEDSEELASSIISFKGDLTKTTPIGVSGDKKSGDEGEVEVDSFAVMAAQSSIEEVTNDKVAKTLNRQANQSDSGLSNPWGASVELNGFSETVDADKNQLENRQKTLGEDLPGNQPASQIALGDSSSLDLKATDNGSPSDFELFNPDRQAQYQNEQRNPASSGGNNIQLLLLKHTFDGAKGAPNSEGPDLNRSRIQDNLAIQGLNNKLEAKATSSDQSTRSRLITRPQLTRMLERVESTLKEAARSRDGKTISLKLEPVDLGRVQVDISLRDGVLHARISPESQQVRTALREHAHELQGALRKLGLDVESVAVSVTAEDFSQQMAGGNGGAYNGSGFQDERQNMPTSGAQVHENTIGNELAEGSSGAIEGTKSSALSEDHWVA